MLKTTHRMPRRYDIVPPMSIRPAREDDFDTAEHMRQGMELHYKAHGMLRGATDRGIISASPIQRFASTPPPIAHSPTKPATAA